MPLTWHDKICTESCLNVINSIIIFLTRYDFIKWKSDKYLYSRKNKKYLVTGVSENKLNFNRDFNDYFKLLVLKLKWTKKWIKYVWDTGVA